MTVLLYICRSCQKSYILSSQDADMIGLAQLEKELCQTCAVTIIAADYDRESWWNTALYAMYWFAICFTVVGIPFLIWYLFR